MEGHLYLQIARQLKDEIVDGVHPVGSQLPTESELCVRFNVSRHTVREALRRLRDDHLVTSRQGAGTIVTPRRPQSVYAQDAMSIGDLLDFAQGARFIIQSIRMQAIDGETAARLGLPNGEERLVALGVRQSSDEGGPLCWTEYYIHRDFAAVGRLLPRHTGPIFPLIEDLFGQTISEVRQEIGATLMPAAPAEALCVERETAALEVRRSYVTSSGVVAQSTINLHPAARFRHTMTMRRLKT